jgi:CHAD domain-containing protein
MYRSPSGKIVYKFFKEKEQEFQFHLGRLKNAINEEDIHYLRRATKRIKAIYKLFQQIDPEFKAKKRFSPISAIYETAGQLRELQVNCNTLLSYQPSHELVDTYSKYIQTSKTHYFSLLAEAIQGFNEEKQLITIKKIKGICSKISKKKLVKSSSELIQHKFSGLKEMVMVAHGETDFHATRILLKQLSPSMAIMEFIQQEGFNKELLGLFKTIEDKMGYWHDRYVLHQSLKHMIENQNIASSLKAEAVLLIKKIETEDSTLLKKIERKLKLAIANFSAVSLGNF